MAITMYKRNKAWLQMLKLVQQHKREQLPQAHLLVAQVGTNNMWLFGPCMASFIKAQ